MHAKLWHVCMSFEKSKSHTHTCTHTFSSPKSALVHKIHGDQNTVGSHWDQTICRTCILQAACDFLNSEVSVMDMHHRWSFFSDFVKLFFYFNFQKHWWPTPFHIIQFNLITFVFDTYVLRFYCFTFLFCFCFFYLFPCPLLGSSHCHLHTSQSAYQTICPLTCLEPCSAYCFLPEHFLFYLNFI